MRGWASTMILMAACANHEPPLPPVPPQPPRDEPPTLANLPPPPPAPQVPPDARPPVGPGDVRLTRFDVDVAAPPGTKVSAYGYAPTTEVSWNGCSVDISARPATEQPRAHHRVGTLELDCTSRFPTDPNRPGSRDCLAVCEHMHAVPGGTANEEYPTELPVLEVVTSGGIVGSVRGERVWRDGTIQYYGSECPASRGVRGRLPREHVVTLLRELVAGGFFAYTHDLKKWPPCPDSFSDKVTVRTGGREHTIVYDRCSRAPKLADFGERLTGALGKNPCF
jgi:hypothetical protein